MRLKTVWTALALSVVLAACGGGGGDAGKAPFGSGAGSSTGGTSTGTGTGGGTTPASGLGITLALSSSTVTVGNPATVTATVSNRNGPVAGALVTFSSTNNLGAFTPSAGTALTDANGAAVVALSPASASASGAAQITAATAVNGESVSASTGFQLSATNVAISDFNTGLAAGATLAAYGQTVPTVTITGAGNGTPVTVTLNSTCLASGKARVSPASAVTTTGTATFTYTDNGCGADRSSDTLSASITNATATAQRSLPLAVPTASSLSFVSATPSTIFLRGASLAEQAAVVFEVRDQAGNAFPNRQVTLELSTFAGGLTIEGGSSAVVRTSDAQGRVSALVNSGTVPTPVRVRATLAGPNGPITTVSNELTVAVGLPSQANFGLAQTAANIEGYDYIDTPNTYTIIASDRRGNPVPTGTAINFTAEGGQVQASRTIAITPAGIARADAAFVSNLPKPLDGRVTIVAYALGEESFKDLNGNNVYDPNEPFQDLGDVYLDRLYNGVYEAANDEFISLQLPGTVLRAPCVNSNEPELRLDTSVPSRQLDGTTPTCNGAWGQAYVRRAIETVLSTSAARPVWGGGLPGGSSPGQPVILQTTSAAGSLASFDTVNGTVIGSNGAAAGSFSFLLGDANPVRLNPMPAGTSVTVEGSTGVTATVVGGSPVPSSLNATVTGIRYEFDTAVTPGSTRSITIRITSPKGLTTALGVLITR